MASKNMTTIMALYFTFNLVFLGFTSAQPPVEQPVCPLNLLDLQVCLDLLGSISVIINPQSVAPCCTLLTGIGGPLAAVCACDAARVNLLGITVGLRLNQLIRLCPAARPPPGVNCIQ